MQTLAELSADLPKQNMHHVVNQQSDCNDNDHVADSVYVNAGELQGACTHEAFMM